jgi:hypothetical protein
MLKPEPRLIVMFSMDTSCFIKQVHHRLIMVAIISSFVQLCLVMLIDAVFLWAKVIKFFQRINAIVLKSWLAVF